MKVFRFANPIHYVLESDVRDASGELVSRRTEAVVLRYGDEAESLLYCVCCGSRDCHHVGQVLREEPARSRGPA